MSQGPLCPNLSQKVQKKVYQMANRNLSRVILLGGLSVNLNHLKTMKQFPVRTNFTTPTSLTSKISFIPIYFPPLSFMPIVCPLAAG